MSFILDALRKAETKNRTQHKISVPRGPDIVDDDIPSQPTDWPKTLILAIAGLALVAVGLLIGSSRDSSQRESIVQQPPLVTPPIETEMVDTNQNDIIPTARDTNTRALDLEARKGTAARRPAAQNTEQAPAPRKGGTVTIMPAPGETGSEETSAEQSRIGQARLGQARNGQIRIGEANTGETATRATTPTDRAGSVKAMAGTVQNESLPEYRSVLMAGNVVLPRLHLDMHVFSEQPQKRFVFINLTKYRQGEELDNDTLIESIRTDGAVLNHKGFRFVLRPE